MHACGDLHVRRSHLLLIKEVPQRKLASPFRPSNVQPSHLPESHQILRKQLKRCFKKLSGLKSRENVWIKVLQDARQRNVQRRLGSGLHKPIIEGLDVDTHLRSPDLGQAKAISQRETRTKKPLYTDSFPSAPPLNHE